MTNDQIVVVIQFSVLYPGAGYESVHTGPAVFCEDICMFLQRTYIKRSVLPLAENE